jgi:multisubunit Na+/H+ antiporter MnhC subunit
VTTPPPAPVLLDPAVQPLPSSRWRPREELRADLRPAAWLVLALAGVGVPAGLVWWLLAPRADFRITEDGPVVVGSPSSELLVADDAVFVLVLAVVGLLAGVAAWLMRRQRGVALLVALALGTTAAGAVAWLVGELFGEGPTEAELSDIGGTVTTGLDLGATAALAVAPFVALVVYVLGVIMNAEDGLGRAVPPVS